MATIEDKIKLFSKIVYEKAQEEEQSKLEEFEKEKEKTLEKEKIKLEEKKSSAMEETRKKAALKVNEIIAAVKVQSQNEVLEAKRNMIDEIMKELNDKLENFTLSEDYHDFLIKQAMSSTSDLEEGSFILELTHRDFEKYGDEIKEKVSVSDNKNFEIEESDEEMIGGLILESTSHKFRINNSLAARLMEYKEKVGIEIIERIG